MSTPLNISVEELSLICFEDFENQNYPLRLAYYKDNKYFYKGEFSARTNGIGETRSFRAYLNEFIKSYKPKLINKEKDLWLALKSNGEFVVTKGEQGKRASPLSKDEALLFNLICYINLVRFWDDFNEIRNINSEKTPVVIKLSKDFSLCSAFTLNCLLNISEKLNRRLVIQQSDD